MPKARSIVVTVDDEHLSAIDKVAERLRAKGMKVEEIMKATGMITGSYSRKTDALRKIAGVLSVEEPTQFQLPPPDSSVQ